MFKKAIRLFLSTPPEILRAGHPILRAKAIPLRVTELASTQVLGCVEEMKKAFSSKLTPVIGLAAPQVGHSFRLIAYQLQDQEVLKSNGIQNMVPLTFLVNPVLKVVDNTEKAEYEFCESIPSYSGIVRRPLAIHVSALDLNGNVGNQPNFSLYLKNILDCLRVSYNTRLTILTESVS